MEILFPHIDEPDFEESSCNKVVMLTAEAVVMNVATLQKHDPCGVGRTMSKRLTPCEEVESLWQGLNLFGSDEPVTVPESDRATTETLAVESHEEKEEEESQLCLKELGENLEEEYLALYERIYTLAESDLSWRSELHSLAERLQTLRAERDRRDACGSSHEYDAGEELIEMFRTLDEYERVLRQLNHIYSLIAAGRARLWTAHSAAYRAVNPDFVVFGDDLSDEGSGVPLSWGHFVDFLAAARYMRDELWVQWMDGGAGTCDTPTSAVTAGAALIPPTDELAIEASVLSVSDKQLRREISRLFTFVVGREPGGH